MSVVAWNKDRTHFIIFPTIIITIIIMMLQQNTEHYFLISLFDLANLPKNKRKQNNNNNKNKKRTHTNQIIKELVMLIYNGDATIPE